MLSIVSTAVFANQDNFTISFSLYSLSFFAFFQLWKIRKVLSWRTINITLIITGALLIPITPNLSPDYFRFLWDGQLILDGVNPYAYTPAELMKEDWVANSTYYQELFKGITQLSKENYSCYPSINQFYFAISSLFSNSIWINLMVMRVLIMGTLILLYKYTKRILKALKKEEKGVLLIFFNPFVLQELAVNLHFEGVMIAFLAVSIYFLLKRKLLLSALFFALAVNIKLTPLLLLPFVFKTLNIRKTSLYYTFTLALSFLLSSLLLWPQYYENFNQSLALYFANFEFNSFLYKGLFELLHPYFTWNTVYVVGPFLSYISLGIIVFMALRRKVANEENMLIYMFWGYTFYLLLGSTLHPWYLTSVLFLSVFTKSRFTLAWTYLVVLSYAFYDQRFAEYQILIRCLEYVGLILFVWWERKSKINGSLLQ